jgi:hypothetical protein
MTLYNQILAYLKVNNILFEINDFETGQPEGQKDQILHWDTKLGAQPSQDQLDSCYAIYQAQLSENEQAKKNAKTSALAKLTALGLTENEITALLEV